MRNALGCFSRPAFVLLFGLLFADCTAADTPSVEESAVRAAALAGTKAIFGEDRAAVDKWVTFRYSDGSGIIDYYIKKRLAERELRDAVAKRFGKPGANYAADQEPDHHELDSDVRQIEKGSITIDGEAATVTSPYSVEVIGPVPGMERPIWPLKKVGGSWKLVDLHGYAKDVDVRTMRKEDDDRLARLMKMIRDVREGAYKTLDDLDRDIYDFQNASTNAAGFRVMSRRPIDPQTGKRKELETIVITGGGSGRGIGDGTGVGPAAAAAEPRKIVYVIDASEASKQTFPLVKAQMRAAVGLLRAPQVFAIIVPVNGEVRKSGANLMFVTPENKRAATDFIDGIRPAGKSDLVAAMKAAVALNPEVIYLTTSAVPKEAKLRESIATFIKGKKVKINTMAIEGKGEFEAELKGIAQDSDGVYKYVSVKDLENQ